MNKKIAWLLGVAGLLALAGCGGGSESSSLGTGSGGGTSVSGTSITEADLDRGLTTYTDEQGQTQQLNRDTLYRNAGDPHVASYSEGGVRQKLLVAPIRFQKDPNDSNDVVTADDALYERIRITFEGTPEETERVGGYISLNEFYETSSFGKGSFDVVMLPTWVDYPGTPNQFYSAARSTGAGIYASEFVRSWYIEQYALDGHGLLGEDAEPLTYFDSDDDGFIDLVWNVYAYPFANNDTSFWWAYVTYTSNQANTRTPTVKTLAWASTSFMDNGYNGYDSHTFIHETGHTLGLNDYYDYSNTWKPMAGVDYMDQNLGDHNAYSKFSLGWINPYILREEDIDGVADEDGVGEGVTSAEITLRHSSLSGDALVLASPGYNGTAFDEYLILELVGPAGICETDYTRGYQNTTGFTEYGIRMLHVDARTFSTSWATPLTDVDDIGRHGVDVRVSNSFGGRGGIGIDGDFWRHGSGTSTEYEYYTEVSIIESSFTGGSTWKDAAGYNATNDALFQTGTRFQTSANSAWVQEYFPSRTNLWNKAKTITSNATALNQVYTVDEDMTCNYRLRISSIEEDDEFGAVAKLTISLC